MIGQIDHKMEWREWYDIDKGTDEIVFVCSCRTWRVAKTIDPIRSFRGKVLQFQGESVSEVVLKVGIAVGRDFQKHLETAQVDVVMWAGHL